MISVVELEDELNDEILEIIEFAKKKWIMGYSF